VVIDEVVVRRGWVFIYIGEKAVEVEKHTLSVEKVDACRREI